MKKLLAILFAAAAMFVGTAAETSFVNYSTTVSSPNFDLIWEYETTTVSGVTSAIITGVKTSGGDNPTGDLAVPYSVSATATGPAYVVKAIADGAFANQIGITSISIPVTVESIGAGLLSGCTVLSSISVDEGNPWFSSFGGALYDRDHTKLIACPARTEIIMLPATLAEIGQEAFANCHRLLSLSIPASVTGIGSQAFMGCSRLASVEFKGNAPTADGTIAIGANPSLTFYRDAGSTGWDASPWDVLNVKNAIAEQPSGVVSAMARNVAWHYRVIDGEAEIYYSDYEAAIPTSTSQTFHEEIIEGVRHWVGDGRLVIPSSLGGYPVTRIGVSAFKGCSALAEIEIPSTIRTIGDFAFAGCTGLNSINIPSGVRKIGRHPFSGAAITSITLPDSLRELDGSPLAGCDTILSVSIDADNSYFTVVNGLLYDTDVLTLIGCPARKESASIASTVTRIGPEAFDGCFRLRALLLPDSLVSVGASAFCGAVRLTSLTFPESVVSLEGAGLFDGCASLSFASFSCNAPNVDPNIFDGAPAGLQLYAAQGTKGWKDATTTALPDSGKWPSDDGLGRAIANLDVPAEAELKEGDIFPTVVANYAYTLKILADKGVEIVGISPKPTADFAVPSAFDSSLGTLTVKSLCDQLFANAIGLLSVSIPNSVTNIGNEVFKDCNVLSQVALSHGLRSVGRHPFTGTAIETIELPDTVSSLDGNILYGCVPSISISVGANNPFFAVSSEGALYDKDFENLLAVPMATETLAVPATTTNIASEAFAGCVRIKNVIFSGDAPAAPDDIFADTPGTLAISVPANSRGWDGDPSSSVLPASGLWRGRPISSNADACTDGTWYWIVQNGTAILDNSGQSALVNTTVAGAINVPQTVTDMVSGKEYTVSGLGARALSGCKFIDSVTLPDSIEIIGEKAFTGTRISTLAIPKFVKSISGNPAAGCEYFTSFTVNKDNICFSADDAGLLYDQSKKRLLGVPARATSITIPETVTEIGADTFAGCAALTDVTYAGNEPTAPDGIYADTPASLTSYANEGAGFPVGAWKSRPIVIKTPPSVNLLTVPVEVTIDGKQFTFNWKYELDFETATAKLITVEPKPINEIEIPGALVISAGGTTHSFAVTEICDGAFRDAQALTKVKTSEPLLDIGDFAFSNCTALAELELSYGLRSIGKRPFVNTAIPELTLPDTLLDMEGNIAAGAIYDIKLNISDSSHFTYSDDGALYNRDMTRLYACPTRAEGTITIPSTVTNICADAFFGCFRLSYLNIPENVNTIGSDAFNVYGIWPGLSAPESTPKLQSIFYNGPVPNAADDIYEHAPADLVTYAFTDDWPSTWKDRPVEVITEENPPVLQYKDDNGIMWYYRIIKGEAEIYNEDSNKKPIVAIEPKSTPGVPFHYASEDAQYWSNLWVLNIPSAINGYVVTRIGDHAFDGCNNLTRVGLPSSVKSIGDYAFKDCTAIKTIAADRNDSNSSLFFNDGEIELPTGIKSLGYHPFEGLKSFSISIPYTVNETIGNPLAGMEFVTTVEVDAANPKFYSSGNIIYNKNRSTVVGVPANYDGASISFLSSVTGIGAEALYGCANLSTITLPSSLETISSNAFAGCSSVSSLTIPTTVTAIGAAFTGCDSLARVSYEGNAPIVPDNLYAGTPETMASWINEGATGFSEGTWKERPVIVIKNPVNPVLSYNDGTVTWYFRIIDGMAEIHRTGDTTAVACDSPIMSLTLPDTLGGYIVKGIGDGALSNLRGITTITVPDTYEWIGDNAFSNCTSLASVVLGAGIEKIGISPFYGTKITSLEIPDSVSEIDGNPVAGCSLMQTVEAADSQSQFSVADGLLYDKNQKVLYACPATKTSITLPDTLTTIGEGAFAGCTRLTSVAIPATVKEIGSAAFSGCTSLVQVEYAGNAPTAADNIYTGTPESLTSWIDKGATGFTEETWKDRPVGVSDPSETQLVWDNGVAKFYYHIVDGMAEIWRKGDTTAVVSDKPIMNLTLPDTINGYIVKGLGNGALSNLRGLTVIGVPNTYEWIGDYVFSNCTSLASVWLYNGIKRIGRWPFYGTNISTLEIPDSVSEIDGNPVAGSAMMTAISVSDTQPYFSVNDGLLYDKKQETLIACPATKTSLSLPGTLETINDDAFYGCNFLYGENVMVVDGVTWGFTINDDGTAKITAVQGATGTITIPAALGGHAVTEIADGVFADCTNITAFVSESTAFKTRSGVLYSADGKELIRVPDTMTLPYTVTTSIATATVTETSEAGVRGGLPYVDMVTTTNTSSAKVSTVQVAGDISFEALLSGVTRIRSYAFAGVNSTITNTYTSTAGEPSIGWAVPGDNGTVNSQVITTTIDIESVTYASTVTINTAKTTVDENAFAESGITPALTFKPDGTLFRISQSVGTTDTSADDDGLPPENAASTYDGYLTDADGNLAGTIQVKVAKPRNGAAKVTATLRPVGGRKTTAKGTLDMASGAVAGLDLALGERTMTGSLGGYKVSGVRNLFASRDKQEVAQATETLAPWLGVVNVAWNDALLTVTVSAKGKIKVSGVRADGTKVSATSQLLIGADWLCVPVIVTKKTSFAFLLWLPLNGGEPMVEGIDDAAVGRPGALAPNAAFDVDRKAIEALVIAALSSRTPYGGTVLTDELPIGTIQRNGAQWRAGQTEATALNLRCIEKTGTFKGSFKVRAVLGKKTTTLPVSVNGVLANGIGYGTAIVKRAGHTPISIK